MKWNLYLVTLLAFILLSCELQRGTSGIRSGKLIPLDTLMLAHHDLGQTLYGPRVLFRGKNHVCYLMDDSNVYVEFDIATSLRTDRIEFSPYIEDVGISLGSSISGVHWLTDEIALLTVLSPHPCFVNVDFRDSTARMIHLDIANDKYVGSWPYSHPCALEQRLANGGMISAVQIHVRDLQHSKMSRETKYSGPPLIHYTFNNDGSIHSKIGIGAYPDFYRRDFVRMMMCAFDTYGSDGILTFEASPIVYFFSTSTFIVTDSITLTSSTMVEPKPFESEEENVRTVREYYYTTSRAPIVKWISKDRFTWKNDQYVLWADISVGESDKYKEELINLK